MAMRAIGTMRSGVSRSIRHASCGGVREWSHRHRTLRSSARVHRGAVQPMHRQRLHGLGLPKMRQGTNASVRCAAVSARGEVVRGVRGGEMERGWLRVLAGSLALSESAPRSSTTSTTLALIAAIGANDRIGLVE
jgi:hypothetical protein